MCLYKPVIQHIPYKSYKTLPAANLRFPPKEPGARGLADTECAPSQVRGEQHATARQVPPLSKPNYTSQDARVPEWTTNPRGLSGSPRLTPPAPPRPSGVDSERGAFDPGVSVPGPRSARPATRRSPDPRLLPGWGSSGGSRLQSAAWGVTAPGTPEAWAT